MKDGRDERVCEMRLDKKQQELHEYMSEISQMLYCATWYMGAEFVLWEAVVNGPRQWGQDAISSDMIDKLKKLSAACGGWCYFENQFVPMDDWLVLYRYKSSIKKMML